MFFFFKSHRGFRECLAPSLRPTASRESVFASVVLFVTVSQLTCYSITRENCVFSIFYVADVTCFSNHFNFPRSSLSNLFPPKSLFYSNPFIFKQDICKISSRYVLLTPFFIFPLKIMQKFSSGSWKLGIFRKWVEVLRFREFFFFNFWLGYVTFVVWASVLAHCGSLSLYSSIFHCVLALFIVRMPCCMLGVWQNVWVTFMCWLGLY